MYRCGCDQVPPEGVSWVYACEDAYMNVSPWAPGDKWGWRQVWCRADQVCVTTQECAGRGLCLSATGVGKGQDEWKGLRVEELMGACDSERCVCIYLCQP